MDVAAVAQALSSRIGAFDGLGDDRPYHVLVRAALLVGEDDAVYVDDDLSRSLESSAWSGDLVIFTPRRVIRLTVSPAEDANDPAAATTVEATSWARRSLRSVAELGADQEWDETPAAEMSVTTGLRLTYADGQEVEIPSRWGAGAGRANREAVLELLPSLWKDLAARS
jgi:hypothetical protein